MGWSASQARQPPKQKTGLWTGEEPKRLVSMAFKMKRPSRQESIVVGYESQHAHKLTILAKF